MARQIYSFAVTVSAGTAKTAPASFDLTIPTRQVDELEVLVPPGPSGQVGFTIGVSGTPIIPYNAAEWIVTDDEKIRWPLEDYPDSGDWTLSAYNTGAYDHTLYVRLLCSLVSSSPAPPPTPILAASLSGGLSPLPVLS